MTLSDVEARAEAASLDIESQGPKEIMDCWTVIHTGMARRIHSAEDLWLPDVLRLNATSERLKGRVAIIAHGVETTG